MVIEINKDIEKYKESVVLGLTAKQLIFSVLSVVIGAGIVLLTYKYIGLTGSAYIAIPCVAPIALGGFYSFNGMSFYKYMGKKLHFMFRNKPLLYVSTESEDLIKQLRMKQNKKNNKSKSKKEAISTDADSVMKKQEEFEASKKKMKNMLIGLVACVIMVAAGLIAYKYFK